MILRTISVRTQLLLATLLAVLLIFILALFYMDGINRLRERSELLEQRATLQSEYLVLRMELNRRFLHTGTDDAGSRQATVALRQIRTLQELLDGDPIHRSIAGHSTALNTQTDLLHTLNRLSESLRVENVSDPSSVRHVRANALWLDELMSSFDRHLTGSDQHLSSRLALQGWLTLSLGLLLIAGILILFARGLRTQFDQLLSQTGALASGKMPPPLKNDAVHEFGLLARYLDTHLAGLDKKIRHIRSLSEEGYGEIYQPSPGDELGNALQVLSEYLTRKELDEITRNREDKKQNWISEGMAQMGDILRAEREEVTELSFLIIQKLVTYMNLEMGALFLTNESDPEKPSLDLLASYAYDRRKYLKVNLEWGSGLPGTCAQEGKRIFMTEVPEDYFVIASGAGESRPNCILLVPLKIDERVTGVIELATIRLLRPFEIEFVESMAESIASSLLAVRNSEQTARLLKQSRAQADALQEKEAAMLASVEKLEQAQEESRRKETEISGIVHALNQSSLVAELGLNKRFSQINDRFLLLLESSREQVLGKVYTEFAQTDPYSDEYKNFWEMLRKGESISNTQQYKLYSGKEVWLQQTFTPIADKDGRVSKVLLIADDVSGARQLQEKLETREQEIARSQLEMKTLNEAVNSALIKCDLDAEGIIMEVNENFTEVTGYSRKELLGRNYRLFLKDTEKEQFEKIWQEVKKEKVYEGVVRRSKPTGEEVWLVSTFSPVKDESGVIYKVYYMGLDITEKKLKYQLLEDANQEIERLKGQLRNNSQGES